MTIDLDLSPEAVERLADDCILASKALHDTGTFETGQAILGEAADALSALMDEIERLRAERDAAWKAGAWVMRAASISATDDLIEATWADNALRERREGLRDAADAIRALPMPDNEDAA